MSPPVPMPSFTGPPGCSLGDDLVTSLTEWSRPHHLAAARRPGTAPPPGRPADAVQVRGRPRRHRPAPKGTPPHIPGTPPRPSGSPPGKVAPVTRPAARPADPRVTPWTPRPAHRRAPLRPTARASPPDAARHPTLPPTATKISRRRRGGPRAASQGQGGRGGREGGRAEREGGRQQERRGARPPPPTGAHRRPPPPYAPQDRRPPGPYTPRRPAHRRPPPPTGAHRRPTPLDATLGRTRSPRPTTPSWTPSCRLAGTRSPEMTKAQDGLRSAARPPVYGPSAPHNQYIRPQVAENRGSRPLS